MASKNARRVTEAEALGETAPTSPDDLRNKYTGSTYLDVRIPETILDDIRLEAHFETAYPNSQVEAHILAAVDAAISERVQRAAYSALEQTRHLLQTEGVPGMVGPRQTPNALAKADAHLSEIAAIRRDLRDGKASTADLAERFERVRMKVQNTDGNSLVAVSNRATSLRTKVADPKAAIGRTLSLMPRSTWRPLGISAGNRVW